MRRKHGLLLFLASCIPGCGEMYQGYMKRGISILAGFYGLLTVAIYLEIGALAVLMLPIWLFSFFDSYNLRGQTDEEAAANPDDYLFGVPSLDLEKLDQLRKKRASIIGWLLVILGVWGLYSIVSAWLVDALGVFFADSWWLYRILNYDVPRLVVTVGIIALGVWFIRGPRSRKEDIPPFTPPAEDAGPASTQGETSEKHPTEDPSQAPEQEADHHAG